MKKIFLPLAFAVLTLGGACAQKAPKKPPGQPAPWFAALKKIIPRKKTPPPAASPVNWAGTVRMVNAAENFALVESETSLPVIPGEKYLSVQSGRETGTVLITALRAHPFLIADIVEGDPSPGDKIYIPRPAWSQTPPADGHDDSTNPPPAASAGAN